MIQLRLAWWRDRLGEPADTWPRGEPLLAILPAWDAERAALAALVDAWEAASVGEDGGAALIAARAGTILALARLAGLPQRETIVRAAQEWAADRPIGVRLPRALRPLTLLQHFAQTEAGPLRTLVVAVRKGLVGI